MSNEQSPKQIWADRLEKRNQLSVLNRVERLNGQAAFFNGFVFKDGEEPKITAAIQGQMFYLTGMQLGVGFSPEYRQLLSASGVTSERVDLDKYAVQVVKDEPNQRLLSAFYKNRLVSQGIYDLDKSEFTFFADIFYYRHAAGGESVIETNRDIYPNGQTVVTESFYTLPLKQEQLLSLEARDNLVGLYIYKNTSDKRIYSQKVSRLNGFSIREVSTFENLIETERQVAYESKNNLVTYLAKWDNTEGGILVLRRSWADKNLDEQWVYTSGKKIFEHSDSLDRLAVGVEPQVDSQALEFKMILSGERVFAQIGRKTLMGEVDQNEDGDIIVIFRDSKSRKSLIVGVGEEDNILWHEFINGVPPTKDPALN